MPECHWYGVDHRKVTDPEIDPEHRATSAKFDVPYCKHKHSPLTLIQTYRSNVHRELKCEGKLAQCPLTPEHFADT